MAITADLRSNERQAVWVAPAASPDHRRRGGSDRRRSRTMSLSRAIRRAGIVAGLVVLAVGGTALPANAADFVFPSCPGFDVGLTPLTNHGNPVQAGPRAVVAAGSGTSFVDNETTGATITFLGAGAFKIEENPDGSLTLI